MDDRETGRWHQEQTGYISYLDNKNPIGLSIC